MKMKYIVILFAIIKSLSCDKKCEESAAIIDVSNRSEHCVNKLGSNYNCPTIGSALSYLLSHKTLLTRTCIRLHGDQNISKLYTLNDVNQLIIKKHESVSTFVNITCSPRSGFALYDSTNITLYGLRFRECGVEHSTRHKYFSTTLNMTTALYVYQVKHVNVTDVTFVSSNGYAVVLIDVSGDVHFKRLNVSNGKLVSNLYQGNQTDGYSSGGGVYIEYRNTDVAKYSSNSNIQFEFCNFTNNKADTYNKTPDGKGADESQIPFGRGGGLTLMISGRAKGNRLIVRNCTFVGNVAASGGSVYIRFQENASTNRILLDGVKFRRNSATISGGGLIVSSTQDTYYNNMVSIKNCWFIQNNVSSGEGGGLTLRYLKHHPPSEEDGILENCMFVGNTALIGSGLHLQNANVKLIDLKLNGSGIAMLQNPDVTHNRASGLYAFQCRLVIFGKSNLVSHNKITGFILDSSSIDLNGQLDFISNEGYNGGALSLFGHSTIILNQTAILNFRNNYAKKNGGAIYVSVPNSVSFPNYIDFHMYPCFFDFKDGISEFNGKTTFENNSCDNSGYAIFTSTLQNCKYVKRSATRNIKDWRNFVFSDNQTVATNAINISIVPDEWNVWPGKVFKPRIHIYDEQDNIVDEAVDISIHSESNKVHIESRNRRFLVEDSRITLKLLVQELTDKMKYYVTVSLARDGYIKTKSIQQDILPCQLGFTFTTNQCECNIQHNEVRGIAACYNDESYILVNRWARPNQAALVTDSETTQVCPPNYCRTCKANVKELACLYEPDNQCQPYRDQKSDLCSKCMPNRSVAIGGEKCIDCTGAGKWNFLWIIPLMILVTFLVIVIIVFLNIDIYVYYLNGFFYYYQVVMLLLPSNFQFWAGLEGFISIINLSGVASRSDICLWNGLNDLEKIFFNYLIPVLMISILIVLSAFIEHFNRIGQINCINAFIVITVWAYADLTRITFLLLKPDTIDGKCRVHIYADASYLGTRHLPYFIIACIFLIIIIVFPFVLILSSRLRSLKYGDYNNPLARWEAVFNSFKDCFKPDRRFFVSYYFLCRLLLLGITTFADKTPGENIGLALLCLFICMIFQVFLPYDEERMNFQNKWTNAFDLLVLANLTAVSILSLATRSARKEQEKYYFMTVVNVLMCIPLTLVLIRVIYLHHLQVWEFTKKHLCKSKEDVAKESRKMQLMGRTVADASTEDRQPDELTELKC